jgi:hypothetical protein
MIGGLQQKEKQPSPVNLIGIALFLTSGGFPVQDVAKYFLVFEAIPYVLIAFANNGPDFLWGKPVFLRRYQGVEEFVF